MVLHHFLNRREVLEAAHDHAADVIRAQIVQQARPSWTVIDLLSAVLPTTPELTENWRFVLSIRAAAMHEPDLGGFEEKINRIWADSLPTLLRDVTSMDPEVGTRQVMVLVTGIAVSAVLAPDAWSPEAQRHHLRTGFSVIADPSDLSALPAIEVMS